MRTVKLVSGITRILGILAIIGMAVLPLQVGAVTKLDGPPDAVSVLSLSALSSSDQPGTALEALELAQQGNHNILALGSDLPDCLRQDVYLFLRERYGEQLLLWGVQEADRLEYVYAYPLLSNPKEARDFSDALTAFIQSYPPEASCDLTSDPMPAVQVLEP